MVLPPCKNCNMDCCCDCIKVKCNEYCHFCNKKPFNFNNSRICSTSQLSGHWICWDCKRGWQSQPTKYNSMDKCTKCNKYATKVSTTVRVPKATDTSGWEILEFMIKNTDTIKKIFRTYPPNTQGYHFGKYLDRFCMFGFQCIPRKLKPWDYPKNLKDYPNWLIRMRDPIPYVLNFDQSTKNLIIEKLISTKTNKS
jgi:hypothetical protein